MDFVTSVTLQNDLVRLEPLSDAHAEELAAAAADAVHPWYTVVPSAEEVPSEIARRLAEHAAGRMNPFAIRRVATGRLVGMTTYCNVDQPNRRVEIGYTWLTRSAQGTEVNAAAKRLLLQHAFEACDAISVQLFTHAMNGPSRAAIERLGAKLDGILRSHRIMADGSLRDTAVYSILPHEWPAVRSGLDARLARHRA
ncbi:GNAT family N-acetyltransferase [Microbacterium resistens]|uniref:GNAT family N-acetyltransferase n=1 Tax=Microbacterium resistens TaxID=156977 RepID=UPI001C5A07C2|nr:GNAT family protein [Microbacterium resistens]MBW1638439.1 GNAT family N-acetyltransferase [Microbacterium resistens]